MKEGEGVLACLSQTLPPVTGDRSSLVSSCLLYLAFAQAQGGEGSLTLTGGTLDSQPTAVGVR